MCVDVSAFTCVDSNEAVYAYCPELAAAVAVMLWLLLMWTVFQDSAAPSTPTPTRSKQNHVNILNLDTRLEIHKQLRHEAAKYHLMQVYLVNLFSCYSENDEKRFFNIEHSAIC